MADDLLKRTLTRRTFVLGLGLTAASGLLAACGGGGGAAGTPAPAATTGGAAAAPTSAAAAPTAAATKAAAGATIQVTEAPFADLFPKVQQVATTGAGDFDCLLLANSWVADFVNLGYTIPLAPYFDKSKDDPNFNLKDIPQGLIAKDTWGGAI